MYAHKSIGQDKTLWDEVAVVSLGFAELLPFDLPVESRDLRSEKSADVMRSSNGHLRDQIPLGYVAHDPINDFVGEVGVRMIRGRQGLFIKT